MATTIKAQAVELILSKFIDNSKETTGNKTPKSIVVGASFGGLSAAFSLSCQGHDVLVIDNRSEYTREQKIFVSEDMIEQFYHISDLPALGIEYTVKDFNLKLNYPGNFSEPSTPNLDLEFFRLIGLKGCAIAIKDFQNYQFNKFQGMLEKNKFSYPMKEYVYVDDAKSLDNRLKFAATIASEPTKVPAELMDYFAVESGIFSEKVSEEDFALSGKVQFLRGSEYRVLAIDGDNQILTLESNGKSYDLPFDYLIGADGSKHETANLLFEKNPRYTIRVGELPKPKHNAYGTMVFELAPDCSKYLKDISKVFTPNLKNALCYKHVELLGNLGWKKDFIPLIYIQIDREKNECYITGEVLEEFLSNNQSLSRAVVEKMENWFKGITAELTKIPVESFNLKEGSASTFQVKTQYFTKNHILLGKKGHFMGVGDHLLPANFLYGHGIESAIGDGNVLFDCFDEEGSFDPQPLEARLLERLDQYRYYFAGIEEVRRISSSALDFEENGSFMETALEKAHLELLNAACSNIEIEQRVIEMKDLLQKMVVNLKKKSIHFAITLALCSREMEFLSSELKSCFDLDEHIKKSLKDIKGVLDTWENELKKRENTRREFDENFSADSNLQRQIEFEMNRNLYIDNRLSLSWMREMADQRCMDEWRSLNKGNPDAFALVKFRSQK